MVLSIIAAVYNVEPWLTECLESVLALNGIEYELLLVIGNSQDASNEICRSYEARCTHIRVLVQTGRGLSNARNCGLAAAAGDYILFIDADDYLDAGALKQTLLLMSRESRKPDMLISDFCLVNADGTVYGMRKQIPGDGQLLTDYAYLKRLLRHRQDYWNVWRFLYRLDFLKKAGLWFKENMTSEDIDFSTSCILSAQTIFFCHTPYYYYRARRRGSLQNTATLQRVQDLTEILEGCVKTVRLHREFPYQKQLLQKLFREYFWGLLLIGMVADEERQAAARVWEKHRYLLRHSGSPGILCGIVRLSGVTACARGLTYMRAIRRRLLGRS